MCNCSAFHACFWNIIMVVWQHILKNYLLTSWKKKLSSWKKRLNYSTQIQKDNLMWKNVQSIGKMSPSVNYVTACIHHQICQGDQ